MENFLEALTENPAVRDEFLRQTTPEKAYLVAKPYLDGMSLEDFEVALLGIARCMDEVDVSKIPREKLVAVSGGREDFEKAMYIIKEQYC